MSCIDLSNNSCDQIPQHLSGLCTVCQGIDFVALAPKVRQKTDNVHYHLGKLRNIARKQFCPFCRLILSVARPRDPRPEYLDEATVDIQQQFGPDFSRELDGKIVFTCAVHGAGFFEVTLDGRVAGTIFRREDAGLTDPFGQKSTISESKKQISRRRVVLPEVNISFIKQWMQSCNAQHDPCHLPTLTIARELNIRLIDVQDNRIIPATLAEKYVALSYVWGSTTMPSLIRDTMSQFSSIGGLKDFSFPRTIMDAIHLVRCIASSSFEESKPDFILHFAQAFPATGIYCILDFLRTKTCSDRFMYASIHS